MGALVIVALMAAAATPDTAAQVSFLTGSAESKLGGDWKPIAVGAAIAEGASVRTGKGTRVELTFIDGSRFRISSLSEVLINKASFTAKKREDVSVKLLAGRVWASVAKKTGGKDAFEVTTTNATAGVRGTSFAVLAAGDASALVRVYSGTVGVKPNGSAAKFGDRKQVSGPKEIDKKQWEEIVATAMKEVKVSAAGDLSPAQDFEDAGESLEWAQWNQERDAGK